MRLQFLEFFRAIKLRELRLALFVALAADTLQIAALPLFVPGGSSPADIAIDVAAALILSKLLGWHWAFLPTIVAEVMPGFDLFPTWTAAVLYVSWRRRTNPYLSSPRPLHRPDFSRPD
jgi:hypothetical protein